MSGRAIRLRARWVVPIAAAPIPHGAVLVAASGRVAAVGPDAAVPHPDDAEPWDLGDAALMPGLVNTHAHLELMALRGLVPEKPFPRWIGVIKRLGDALPPGAFRAGARWGVLECFSHGITTIGDTGRTGESARAMAELGARGVFYQEVFGPDPAQADASVQALQDALHALDTVASDRLAIGVSPHAPYTVSEPLLAAVCALAQRQNRYVAMHVGESPEEAAYLMEGRGALADHLRGRDIAVPARGLSPVAWALRSGLEALQPLLIHCVQADAADYQAIAKCGASVAHCPSSNQLLGNGRANLALMKGYRVNVGLGTDSVAAGNNLDLFAEGRLAMMGVPLTPNEWLRLMTSDAADALGAGGAGRIQPGAWGDLCAITLKGKSLLGAHDIEGALASGANAGLVLATWVAGRLVYHDGKWPQASATLERAAFDTAVDAARELKARSVA